MKSNVFILYCKLCFRFQRRFNSFWCPSPLRGPRAITWQNFWCTLHSCQHCHQPSPLDDMARPSWQDCWPWLSQLLELLLDYPSSWPDLRSSLSLQSRPWNKQKLMYQWWFLTSYWFKFTSFLSVIQARWRKFLDLSSVPKTSGQSWMVGSASEWLLEKYSASHLFKLLRWGLDASSPMGCTFSLPSFKKLSLFTSALNFNQCNPFEQADESQFPIGLEKRLLKVLQVVIWNEKKMQEEVIHQLSTVQWIFIS